MIRKIYIILRDFCQQMGKQNISAFASSTAFFIFLSMVPMLIVVCTIIPYTPLTEANLVKAVTDLTPDKVDALVRELIGEVYNRSAGVLSLAAIATVYSAGKGVLALMRGLNSVNGVAEQRNYFVVRFVASLYTVVMLVVVILSLFIMVFGNQLVNFVLHSIPQLRLLASVLMKFRFLFVWFLLTFLFTAVYAYVPNKKLRFREQIPGAVFSAVIWSGFSWGFSIYVGKSDSYSIYGSLSIIVIVMVWMYFCMYIVLIGAYLNRYFRPVNMVLLGRRRRV